MKHIHLDTFSLPLKRKMQIKIIFIFLICSSSNKIKTPNYNFIPQSVCSGTHKIDKNKSKIKEKKS